MYNIKYILHVLYNDHHRQCNQIKLHTKFKLPAMYAHSVAEEAANKLYD